MICKIINSLVSIAHSLNALVEIQTKVLEIAEEQAQWTRDQLERINGSKDTYNIYETDPRKD